MLEISIFSETDHGISFTGQCQDFFAFAVDFCYSSQKLIIDVACLKQKRS